MNANVRRFRSPFDIARDDCKELSLEALYPRVNDNTPIEETEFKMLRQILFGTFIALGGTPIALSHATADLTDHLRIDSMVDETIQRLNRIRLEIGNFEKFKTQELQYWLNEAYVLDGLTRKRSEDARKIYIGDIPTGKDVR